MLDPQNRPVRRALISVSDKSGIVEFAKALHEKGVDILSTGGTAKLLIENFIPVTEVSKHTGFPEIMGGRVKTLHPKIPVSYTHLTLPTNTNACRSRWSPCH